MRPLFLARKTPEYAIIWNGSNLDEVKEFIAEPSLDEASDIVYCLNRLAGALIGARAIIFSTSVI